MTIPNNKLLISSHKTDADISLLRIRDNFAAICLNGTKNVPFSVIIDTISDIIRERILNDLVNCLQLWKNLINLHQQLDEESKAKIGKESS